MWTGPARPHLRMECGQLNSEPKQPLVLKTKNVRCQFWVLDHSFPSHKISNQQVWDPLLELIDIYSYPKKEKNVKMDLIMDDNIAVL